MNDALQERITRVFSYFERMKARESMLKHQITTDVKTLEKLIEEYNKMIDDYALLEQAISAIKQLIVPLTEKGIRKLESLITFGLETVFPDEGYRVEILVDNYGASKTAEIYLVQSYEDGTELKVRARDSIGGGLKSVISLVLRVYFILYYNLPRIVIMDEALSDVAEEYIDGLFHFIHYTVHQFGFKWLIVTHDPRFSSRANRIYRVKRDGSIDLTKDVDPSAVFDVGGFEDEQ